MKISRVFILSMILAAVTLVVFLPALRNGFTNWDDSEYVTANPLVKGLSLATLGDFFRIRGPLYAPLTFLSLGAEYRLFGSNPFGYHMDNVLLHVANVLLVFGLMRWWTGDKAVAFLTALFFGIHPTRVESVAWITERKDVLYAFFFLISFLAYGRYMAKGRWTAYGTSLLFFFFSALAKPMALTFPFLLLGVDYVKGRGPWRRLLVEKIPFFIPLAALGVLEFFLTDTHKGMPYPFTTHLGLTCYGFLFYLKLIVWPASLSSFYPLPLFPTGGWDWSVGWAPLGVACLVPPLVLLCRRSAAGRSGLFFFVVMIFLPLIFNQMIRNPFFVGDRYPYIPAIGLFYIFSAGVVRWYRRGGQALRLGITAILVCLTGTLGIMTFQRTKVWHDSVTLWSDVLHKYPRCTLARMNRAVGYYQQGDYEKALADFEKTQGLEGHEIEKVNNLACFYLGRGDYGQAALLLEKAIARDPEHLDYYLLNLAGAYLGSGKSDRAEEIYRRLLVGPDFRPADIAYATTFSHKSLACYGLGVLAYHRGDREGAMRFFQESVKRDRGFAEGYFALSVLEAKAGHDAEALRYYQQAVHLDPSVAAREKL